MVVNLFAGPGSGKSTGATYIFSQLKMKGVSCELATEFAKDKTWEKNTKVFENQAYIFGKQFFKLSRLHGEVDVVVTDSPLLFSIIYNKNPILNENFNNMILDVFKYYNNINFFVKRNKNYESKGRWESLEEAKEVDRQVENMLIENNINYQYIDGDEVGYRDAVNYVLNCISK